MCNRGLKISRRLFNCGTEAASGAVSETRRMCNRGVSSCLTRYIFPPFLSVSMISSACRYHPVSDLSPFSSASLFVSLSFSLCLSVCVQNSKIISLSPFLFLSFSLSLFLFRPCISLYLTIFPICNVCLPVSLSTFLDRPTFFLFLLFVCA